MRRARSWSLGWLAAALALGVLASAAGVLGQEGDEQAETGEDGASPVASPMASPLASPEASPMALVEPIR